MPYAMDLTEYKTTDDLAAADYPLPGGYHLVVNKFEDGPNGLDAMKVEFIVLAGTAEHQINKRFEETLFYPSPDSRDGGKFARKKLARLALATGLITVGQLGQQVSINWEDIIYRQLKANVRPYERKKDGKTYKGAEIDGLDIFGPLDEEVAHIPVDAAALQMARDAGQVNCLPPNPTGGERPNPAAKPAATPAKPVPTAAPAKAAGAPAAGADPYANL
jgi:hypothetical protein